MAARFACEDDERLGGLVAVAGAYDPLPACTARRPLPVLEIHGTADAAAPYGATFADPRGGVLAWLRTWVARDGCRAAPRNAWQRPGVLRLDWGPCRDGTDVQHLRLVGGAHAWPGGDPPDAGPQFGLSGAEAAWRFLRDHGFARAHR